MPVDPDRIDAITARLVALYRDAEAAIVDAMRAQLVKGVDSPTWARDRLAAVNLLRRIVQAIVAALSREAGPQLREAVAAGYRAGQHAAVRDLPAEARPSLERLRAAVKAVPRGGAMEALAGALIQDVGARHSNIVRDVIDVYRQVIADATARSIAGGLTRRQASQHAWQRLVDQGITGFTDRAGRRWRLSSYVEMAVRTVTQRAAVQGEVDRLASLGVDLVIVSDAVQECVRCRPWEGRVLRIGPGPTGRLQLPAATGRRTVTVDVAGGLTEARGAGLFHPNCRHSVRAYLPGVTKRPDRPTADPEGDAARQRQRAIERHIRRWKEQAAAALDPAAGKAARKKVAAWQKAMRAHLAEHRQLKRLSYREQPGAGSAPR